MLLLPIANSKVEIRPSLSVVKGPLHMESKRFDHLVRHLSTSTSRRVGIRALLGIAAAGAFAADTDAHRGGARRHEKLACRNDQSECTANEQCCSGICKAKPGSGTEFRCVGKHKKKDKNDHVRGNGGDPGPTCSTEHGFCVLNGGCCSTLLCSSAEEGGEGMCEFCISDGNYGCETSENCCSNFSNPGSFVCENGRCVR